MKYCNIFKNLELVHFNVQIDFKSSLMWTLTKFVATGSSVGSCQGEKISFLKNSLQGAFLSWAPCSLAYCSHCEMASMTWSPPLPRDETLILKERILSYFSRIKTVRITYFIKKCNIEGESKLIFESNFIWQLVAKFSCCRCWVCWQSFCVSIHKGNGQHDGLLRLCSLELKPIKLMKVKSNYCFGNLT